MFSPNTSPRRRRASATLAMVLYLAAGVAAPLAHARSEVLGSRPEVEVQHTRHCARIHTEAACQVGVTFQVAVTPSRTLPPDAPRRAARVGGAPETLVARQESSNPHSVRAPPAG